MKILAGKESRVFFYDFLSDIGICGIYLSLALGTAKFKHKINHVLFSRIFTSFYVKILRDFFMKFQYFFSGNFWILVKIFSSFFAKKLLQNFAFQRTFYLKICNFRENFYSVCTKLTKFYLTFSKTTQKFFSLRKCIFSCRTGPFHEKNS